MSKFWKNFVDILLLIFFIFSLFYLFKNLFYSEYNLNKISEYKKSIKGLKHIITEEKKKNDILNGEYLFLLLYKDISLEIYAKDYLWLIPKTEAVFLKKEKK